MAENQRNTSILALALRSQRLGVAVTEGSLELVHWGVIHFKGNTKDATARATMRVAQLFVRFMPSVIAIERSQSNSAINARELTALYGRIRREAIRLSVPVYRSDRDKVRRAFHDLGALSKDDIAAILAKMFPELSPRLPPQRKTWKHEHPAMPIFDAVALAVACWKRERDLE